MLTSVLCLLVWSGYNSTIYFCMDPFFPKSFINLLHGEVLPRPKNLAPLARWLAPAKS